jgi:choline-glycine betaine transporter
MKPVILTIWVFVGLLMGLAFAGYAPIRKFNGDVDYERQTWKLLICAGLGIGCGFWVCHGIFEMSKDDR